MIYRVVLKYSYMTIRFDFENLTLAGGFAKTMMDHMIPDDDRDYDSSVYIEFIKAEDDSEAEEEDE